MTLTGQLLCGDQPLGSWVSDCPKDFVSAGIDALVDTLNRNTMGVGVTVLAVTFRAVYKGRGVDLLTVRLVPPLDFSAACEDLEDAVALAFRVVAVAESMGVKRCRDS